MIILTRNSLVRSVFPALLLILGLSSVSWGAQFWLRAETFTKTMPDASSVTMWGFAQCTSATYASCTPATVPGPRLTVPVGDTTLTINLRNHLTGPLVEPVSLVIPGQTAVMSPVKFTDPQGRQRVKSFTTETPPNNSTTIAYTWNNLKPGTYLYQSGSHPAVQVQMGLYGAVTRDAAAGQAYGPSTAYAAEALLLFSEIDPFLHSQVEVGVYGTSGITSTIDYAPKYFLINGEPHTSASVPLPVGNNMGNSVLLRFLSASLEVRVPVIQGTHLSIVAEDGNMFPFAKQQYSLKLPPGKTTDAIFTPPTYGNYAIYDRRLGLTNGAASGGGMLVNLNVSPPGPGKIGVFQQGTGIWYLDANGTGAWNGARPDSMNRFGSGVTGALPATGDWNGSGTAKIGVFADGTWYLDTNGSGAWDGTPTDALYSFGGGISGALPVAGRWSGTGTANIGVYSNNTWWLDLNGNGAWDGTPTDRLLVFDAGISGGTPVTGDWGGTGTTKIGYYLNGSWYLDLNGNGTWDGTPSDAIYAFGSGLVGAVPVTGDWTGTGATKIGVYVDGLWYVDLDGNGAWDGIPTDTTYYFGSGVAGAVPVAGLW